MTKNNIQLQSFYFKIIAVLISIGALALFINDGREVNMESAHSSAQKKQTNISYTLDSISSSNCEEKAFLAEKPKNKWRKPLWFATPHHTLPDKMDRNIVNQLTLLQAGGKSFYFSSPGTLRHCAGNTETATCSVSNAPAPKFKDSFYNKYFMIVRNPMTLLPYSANKKAILYSGLKGQMPIDQWRKIRKEWFGKMMSEWVGAFTDWMNAGYEVGLYIVYEDLMDGQKGPKVLKEMANVLNEAGFSTVDDKDLPCVWYNGIGAEHIREYHKNSQYEFGDYTPGFSNEEQKLMLEKLEALMADVEENAPLVTVLKRYIKEIEDNFPFDTSTSTE